MRLRLQYAYISLATYAMASLRVSIGSPIFSLEIEGEEAVALKLLKEFEDTKLEIFAEKIHAQAKGSPTVDTKSQIIKNTAEQQNPNLFKETLPNLIIKYTKLSQKEWMAIFARYLENERFTQDDLRQRFNTEGVMTQNKSKNFSTDVKRAIKDGLIRKMNDKEYSLTPEGKTFADSYINGQA